MIKLTVDTRGETCPIPLIETRKALNRVETGDEIEVIGTHRASKSEIPMAVKELGYELVAIEDKNSEWRIIIKKK